MSDHPLRFGLKLAQMNCSLDDLRAVWRGADDAGFDHVWAFDHLNPIRSDPDGVVWEGWTLLAAMAVATRRARVGLMVTSNTYRHPGVLAKMGATVDHLSEGRLEFGFGAGWAEVEHTMIGLEFPPVRERIERLDEACELLKRLWTGRPADFEGRYYRLTGATHNPPPLQQPHPPIWIGGSGERRTLRVVARHADVWNVGGGEVEEAIRKGQVLDRHCEAVGRDPGEIRRSVQLSFDGDVDGALTQLDGFVRAGFTELVLYLAGPDGAAQGELLAERVLPRFKD